MTVTSLPKRFLLPSCSTHAAPLRASLLKPSRGLRQVVDNTLTEPQVATSWCRYSFSPD